MFVRSSSEYEYGATQFAKMPQPKMTASPISPPIASRCRRKRRRAYDHWLRALSSRPASTVESESPACGGRTTSSCETAGSTPMGEVGSVIPDSRVEIPVEDVRNQVEDDDDHRRHRQVRHHGVDVELPELRDEVEADAVEREDGLGDDRPTEQGAEGERRDRHDRDQRIAEDVP